MGHYIEDLKKRHLPYRNLNYMPTSGNQAVVYVVYAKSGVGFVDTIK